MSAGDGGFLAGPRLNGSSYSSGGEAERYTRRSVVQGTYSSRLGGRLRNAKVQSGSSCSFFPFAIRSKVICRSGQQFLT